MTLSIPAHAGPPLVPHVQRSQPLARGSARVPGLLVRKAGTGAAVCAPDWRASRKAGRQAPPHLVLGLPALRCARIGLGCGHARPEPLHLQLPRLHSAGRTSQSRALRCPPQAAKLIKSLSCTPQAAEAPTEELELAAEVDLWRHSHIYPVGFVTIHTLSPCPKMYPSCTIQTHLESLAFS